MQVINNSKFWFALLAFGNAIVAVVLPGLDKSLVAAFNVFVGVVLSLAFGADAGAHIAEKRIEDRQVKLRRIDLNK